MAAPAGNKFALGNEGGRPPIFESAQQLAEKIKSYFDYIQGEKQEVNTSWEWIREPENATVTGLALYLGFESKQSLYDYEKKDEFSYLIKRARMVIENRYEQNLTSSNCTGSIFALKNMGWFDKQGLEHSGPNGQPIPIHNSGQITHNVNFKDCGDDTEDD